MYYDDKTKLAYAVNLLENEAYEWVKPALLADVDKKPEYVQTWAAFRKEFFKMFSDVDIKEVSYQRIQALRQTGSASTYANEFRRHSLNLDWNDEPLRQHFFGGLKSEVKDKVLSPTDFTDLNALIESAIKWDNLLYQRRKDPNNTKANDRPNTDKQPWHKPLMQNQFKPQPWINGPPARNLGTGPAPMDIGTIRGPLSQEEKERRRTNRLCFYCGKPNHTAMECRAVKGAGARKSINSFDQGINEAAKEPPQ